MLLPLLPEDGYRARAMAIGGGGVDREVFYQGGHDDDPATNTVEMLDLGAPNPAWQYVAAMNHPRVLCDSVLLPEGRVLVVGGSSTGKSDVAVDPVLPRGGRPGRVGAGAGGGGQGGSSPAGCTARLTMR